MDLNNLLSEFVERVESRINKTIPAKQPETIYEPFRYIMDGGGKRIRPALTMLSAGACGSDPFSAIDCAAAIEILHNFTLVHDDIMDGSEKRRGRQTVHIKWTPAAAIITGDAMIGYAMKLLPNSKDNSRGDEIKSVFIKGLIEVCEGQGFDMEFNQKHDVSNDDYNVMIAKKTSAILQTAVLMGAHCAEASDEELEALSNFAYHLGIGFQIQDDYLDMTADEKLLGKKVGLDIVEGKKTFLIINAMIEAKSNEDVDLLAEYYQNNGLPLERVPEFDKMFNRLGIYDLALNESQKRFEKAKQSLNALSSNNYSILLSELTDKIFRRKM